mgnify:CR=1 FL=1
MGKLCAATCPALLTAGLPGFCNRSLVCGPYPRVLFLLPFCTPAGPVTDGPVTAVLVDGLHLGAAGGG